MFNLLFIYWKQVNLLMSLIFFYFSIGVASNEWNFFAVGYAVMVFYFLANANGGWMLLLYLYAFFTVLLSMSFLEFFGEFLFEIMVYAELTGATARCAFMLVFFSIIAYDINRFVYTVLPKNLPTIGVFDVNAQKIMLVLSFALMPYLIVELIITGSPLTYQVDRFYFFSRMASPFYKYIYTNLTLLGLIISLSLSRGMLSYSAFLFWVWFCVIVLILSGEKLSHFVLVGFHLMIPFFVNGKVELMSILPKVLIAFVLLFVLSIYHYIILYGSADLVVPRLVSQGQMNYALDLMSNENKPLDVIMKHFMGWEVEQLDEGLYYLMRIVAPHDIVDMRFDVGATFTAPFPANFFYFFGFLWAPVAIAFIAAISGVITALFHSMLLQGHFIFIVILSRLWMRVYLAVGMGDVGSLSETFGILQFFLVVCYVIAVAIFAKRSTLTDTVIAYDLPGRR